MNFQIARNSLGQMEAAKDGNMYQMKISMYATVLQTKNVEYSKTTGKPGQSLHLRDDTGQEEWVKLQGQFEPLDYNSVGKRYEFMVWPFKPEQSPKVYLYCWINRQVSSQNAPQTPQNAPQSKILSPQGDLDAKITQIAERLVTSIEILIDKKLSERFADQYNLKDPDFPEPPGSEDTCPI